MPLLSWHSATVSRFHSCERYGDIFKYLSTVRSGARNMSSECRRVCYRINILGSGQSTVTKQYKFGRGLPAQAGKITVGLASHWPCVTDNSGITTYRLTALGREMSTPPTLQQE